MIHWKVIHTYHYQLSFNILKSVWLTLKMRTMSVFVGVMIRYLNPKEKNPQRIKKLDREVWLQLAYKGIEFPVSVNLLNLSGRIL